MTTRVAPRTALGPWENRVCVTRGPRESRKQNQGAAMLVLMCQAGENRYAIDSARVVEVVPCVRFETVARAPAWIAGAFSYRGRATALVDLTRLVLGEPCPRRWNSRILVVRLREAGLSEPLGILAERVTTAEIDPAAVAPPEMQSPLEVLGPILIDSQGMFQLVDLARLFPADQRAELAALENLREP